MGDGFDGEFVVIIEAKHPSAQGCQLCDGDAQVLAEFLTFYVSAGAGVRVYDATFIYSM